MAFQFNVGDHTSLAPGYIPFTNAGHYSKLKWARYKLFRMVKNNPSCNAYFRSLPNRRSLSDLINDSGIWVNYSTRHPNRTGEIHLATGDIAVFDAALKAGRWMVLATIVHELAHYNGASTLAGNHAAEEAVYHCGLGSRREYEGWGDDPSTPYDPDQFEDT